MAMGTTRKRDTARALAPLFAFAIALGLAAAALAQPESQPAGEPARDPAQPAPALFPAPLPPALAPDAVPPSDPAATPAADAAGDGVSPVIYPPQELPLYFSHAAHLRLPEAPACLDCHPRAASSMSSIDDLMPREAACRPCHAIDRDQPTKAVAAGAPAARCDACHPGYAPGDVAVARLRVPVPNLKFPHRVHVARGQACTGCHGDLAAEGVALATRAQLPAMRSCLACHDDRQAARACTTCHLADAGGFVRTRFAEGALMPSGTLRGAAHDLSFRSAHAGASRSDPDYCASCHQQSFCVDCHDGAFKPMDFHGGNYVALHAIDARRDANECSACHRAQSFCTGCHSRSGVSADGRGSEFDAEQPGRGFHPPGWSRPGLVGPGHHGFAARRNIEQCASCHREEDCVACHSGSPMGGIFGVSPHPPGWATSRRCRVLLSKNPRVCLRCHIDRAELRCAP
ncbi:cytochrome c3 family protein [Haliangium ochraceum]|uniref:Cytochrome c family protein n=1 Tax=Haliangium ochraceum (strain DSM 14365 / JCM 11303 / SMP-2) TaxID=502025 RepID=D0LX38_HALO1|nr:cytochrome c3 family protein [Haliangium ochraceum]ACY16080.1 cytochrome c family protein [Haliangium ochraceum DSM 14365]